MNYEEIVEYLQTGSLKCLSEKLNIPVFTLRRYLQKHNYKFPDIHKIEKTKRMREDFLDIYGDLVAPMKHFTEFQKQLLLGSLCGDSGVYMVGTGGAYLRCEHSWKQLTYAKTKLELLKPFSFSPYINKPNKKNQDYQVGFSCHTSEELVYYRNLFYTETVNEKNHLQKNIFKPEIWLMHTPISLAFWLMDDGKKYGAGFGIVIGKHYYYTRTVLEQNVDLMNKRLGIDLYVAEEKLCYMICARKKAAAIEKVKDYILPDFSYKIGIKECGKFYEQFDWWQAWKSQKKKYLIPVYGTSSNGSFLCVCGKSLGTRIALARHKATCKVYRNKPVQIVEKKHEKENVDHVVCQYCGYKARDIGAHLRYSKKPHPNRAEYKSLYQAARIACQDVERVRKKTCEKTYGDPNYRNSDLQSITLTKVFSDPVLLERIRKTKQERYGNSGYVNVEARKRTLKERYGVDNPMKNKEIAEKTSKTMKLLYGKAWTVLKVKDDL